MDGSRVGEGGGGPRLLEPVGPGSRVGPCPDVSYSEVGGVAVLWEPRTRVLHELTPAGAALWAALDGRTLAEIIDDAAGSITAGERARFERDAVEVLRRLRAVGLAEDVEAGSVRPATAPVGVPPAVVRLTGRIVADAGVDAPAGIDVETEIAAPPGTVIVVLAPAPAVDGEPAMEFVDIDVITARTVAITSADAGTRADDRLVAALHATPDARAAVRRADGGDPTPLSPVGLLAALMAAVPTDPEPHPLTLDALASLAELVPGVVAGDGLS